MDCECVGVSTGSYNATGRVAGRSRRAAGVSQTFFGGARDFGGAAFNFDVVV
jgi:hypothetical protein